MRNGCAPSARWRQKSLTDAVVARHDVYGECLVALLLRPCLVGSGGRMRSPRRRRLNARELGRPGCPGNVETDFDDPRRDGGNWLGCAVSDGAREVGRGGGLFIRYHSNGGRGREASKPARARAMHTSRSDEEGGQRAEGIARQRGQRGQTRLAAGEGQIHGAGQRSQSGWHSRPPALICTPARLASALSAKSPAASETRGPCCPAHLVVATTAATRISHTSC